MPVSQVLTSLINFLIQAAMYLVFWLYFFATGAEVHFTLWTIAIPLVMLQGHAAGSGRGHHRLLPDTPNTGTWPSPWASASSCGCTPPPVVYPLSMLDESPRLKVTGGAQPHDRPH